MFVLIAFFMAIGFWMGVMTISFELPIDLYKSLWNSDIGYFTKIFLKHIKLLVKIQWPSRKQSTTFFSSNSDLVFLTSSILSAKSDPLVCVDSFFWRELNKYFLYFFLKSLFFALLGIPSTPVLVVALNCPLHIIKDFSPLDNNFATESVRENCIPIIHVLVVETECIQF